MVCVCGEFCKFTTCKVKFVSRHVATGSAVLISKKEARAIKFTVKSYYKFSNNEYRPMLINAQFDYCAAQAGFVTSALFTAMMNVFGNNTNINHKCPFPIGEYYVKDVNFRASHLPSLFPTGRYYINLTTHQFTEFLYTALIYFSIDNYGIKDWTMG